MEKRPLPLEDLRKLKKPLHEYYKKREEHISFFEKLGLSISKKVGTGLFFVSIALLTLFWLTWNTLAPQHLRFDSIDNNFALWIFVSNIIQLCLIPLILVSENLQDKQMDLRMETDLNLNIIAEREIENILLHLEMQNERIEEIINRLEKK